MRPGLGALATWNPACLGSTAQVATDLRATLDRAAADTEESATWTRRGWESPGADTAFAQIGATQVSATRLASLCRDLAAALDAGESSVSVARHNALDAVSIARGEGFDVHDDGDVFPSASQIAAASTADRAERESLRTALTDRAIAHSRAIHTALDEVDRADSATTSTIDSICSKLYEIPTSPQGAITVDPGQVPAGSPGWEFDSSVNPRTMAASLVIGGMVEATRMGAVTALDEAPDPVLKKMFGGISDSMDSRSARKALQGVSRAGAVGAAVGAVPAIVDNLDNGMDTPTAVGSEVVGAGTGLVAGALAGAAVGSFGGPVGIVGGFIAGAITAGAVSHFASKGVQHASRAMQEG